MPAQIPLFKQSFFPKPGDHFWELCLGTYTQLSPDETSHADNIPGWSYITLTIRRAIGDVLLPGRSTTLQSIRGSMADIESQRKRALYRAHHRGTKEMDFILGGFADAELSRLSQSDVAAFEDLLAMPDPEIDGWVKGQEAPPQFADLVERIRRYHGLEG